MRIVMAAARQSESSGGAKIQRHGFRIQDGGARAPGEEKVEEGLE